MTRKSLWRFIRTECLQARGTVGPPAPAAKAPARRGTGRLYLLLCSVILGSLALGSEGSGRAAEARAEHWAFQPPVRPEVPAVRNATWIRNPIDAFVAAEHETRGLVPAAAAERHILLRRISLDLIGLPPTLEELKAFLADSSEDAYERVVDRLLASPHYGERWGRHWMDVWRYSDWYGRREVNDVRNSYPHLWRWRDWIVRSLNEDKGYDRMVLEMLAADEIDSDNDANVVATGFLVRSWFSLNYDQWMKDMVEHTGKAFLGIRLNCAHCHDHKYDPITQEEYFRFRAFFEPLELRHDRVPGGPPLEKYKRYVPGSGASLKPIPAGLARVFDADLDAKTFMYKLGDARDRFDRPPVEPGVPAALRAGRLQIEPVRLPPQAWYPGLKGFIQRDETARREAAVQSAERALTEVRQRAAEFEPSHPELARLALKAAEAKLAAARADLGAAQARIEADIARYSKGGPDADSLVRAAAQAERASALAVAQADLKAAEQALTEVELKPASDKKKTGEVEAARKRLAAARQAVANADSSLQGDASDYTPLGPQYPRQSTGRRSALARWIADERNPLTARVAVNHVWMRHFGRPLVETVFDFGRGGQGPTHPELLDWLAVEFIESDWSMKHLHRLVVTSSTYRMNSSPGAVARSNESIDPDNRYLWRSESRRMEAEAIRDSVLCASGRLDQTIGGPEIDPKLEFRSGRRSLYFALHRLQVGMRTTGALSMYGLWQPLGDAITDFRSDLERTQKLPPHHDAYLNYLRAAMKLWRKDIRQKRNLKLGLIDVVGQMGAAALSDDPPPYKRYHERSRRAEAIYARINRKLPITIRGYDDWLETQEDLAGQLGRLNVRQDESTLSRDDTLALINEVKKALKARGVPTRWLDDLAQDPPAVCIDRKFVGSWKAGALYDDLTNTVTLRDPVNTARPSPRNLAVLAHELFHAWYDAVPAWYQLWLSDNQNETVARFLQSRLRGDPLHEAIDKSVGYGTTFGGTAAESLTGIAEVANYWDDGNLVGGFDNDQDRDGWNRLKTMKFPGCENEFRRLEADIENLRKR